jgi:hypothetical protein
MAGDSRDTTRVQPAPPAPPAHPGEPAAAAPRPRPPRAGAGVLAGALGAARYFRVRDQIEKGEYSPEAFAEVVVLALLLAAGVALTIYLALNG